MDWRAHIVALDLTVTQYAGARVAPDYTLATLPEVESCLHPRCVGGGLNLHTAVRLVEEGMLVFYCQGFLRSAGDGEREPCNNRFELKIGRIERAAGASPELDRE
jgi:hypothetical protein